MNNQFNDTAARASARAVNTVQVLIQPLVTRIGMLRNTIAALTLAAYGRPDDMAGLHLPDILESLTALLPDDEGLADQLDSVADSFIGTLMQGVEAERQATMSPDLLVQLIEACSGAPAEPHTLQQLHDSLFETCMHEGFVKVQSAFYSALRRQGYDVTVMVRNGEPSITFERSTVKAPPKAVAKPKPLARKRERLAAGAA